MPNPPLTEKTMREAVAYVQAAVDAGHAFPRDALMAAAKATGIHRETLRHRMAAARDRLGLEVQVHDRQPEEIVFDVAPKMRVRIKALATADDAPVYRVMAMGDIHAKPGRTTDPVTWAARHAAATKPDRIIQIGDWLSLDSCSMHPARGSYSDHDRPSFSQDIEAGEESLWAFDRECPRGEIPRTVTLGNHEERAWRRAEADPKVADDFPLRVEQVFARYGWETCRYGVMFYYGGVGWVHVPLNSLGRAYGGKHSENAIGNDATHSLVWGHDHRFRSKTVAKIGPNNRISLVNLGTCMPDGEIEDYSIGTTGWTYGLVDVRIQAGLITSAKFIDMKELKERYGD